MEAPSWRHQLVLASYLGSIAAIVVRLITPGVIAPFEWAFLAIAMVFFLPYIWWGTAVGYAFGIIAGGLFGVVGHGVAVIQVANENLPGETLFIFIPGLVFAVLLIGSSVLAWREG